MNIEEIKFIYDSDPNMTLSELAKITGELEDDLFYILTCTEEEYND